MTDNDVLAAVRALPHHPPRDSVSWGADGAPGRRHSSARGRRRRLRQGLAAAATRQ